MSRSQPAPLLVVRRQGLEFGADVYEAMVAECLKRAFDVREVTVPRTGRTGMLHYLSAFSIYRQLSAELARRTDCRVCVCTIDAVVGRLPPDARVIVIVHDFDFTMNRHKWLYRLLSGRILRRLRRADAVVVGSAYWESYLRERGVTHVYRIYSAFPVDQFNFSRAELAEFKDRLHLGDKPMVYVGGTGGKGKGIEESLRALEGLDVQFVATGRKPCPDVRVKALYLEYWDYLRLLTCCRVVLTLSQAKEGWCRIAHEAMLCKTPVIGSGTGGMTELLEGGRQLVLSDPVAIRTAVTEFISDARKRRLVGENGFAYARQFGIDRFERGWVQLMTQIAGPLAVPAQA